MCKVQRYRGRCVQYKDTGVHNVQYMDTGVYMFSIKIQGSMRAQSKDIRVSVYSIMIQGTT